MSKFLEKGLKLRAAVIIENVFETFHRNFKYLLFPENLRKGKESKVFDFRE